MKIEIRGKVYHSADEAALVLGVSRNTIYSALSKGTLDTVGLGPGRYDRRKPVTYFGVTFDCLATAAAELGYSCKQSVNDARRLRPHLLRLRVMRYVAKLEQQRFKDEELEDIKPVGGGIHHVKKRNSD
jgi:hypothetical protein